MRVVVAHNRYRDARPSGENRIVDLEIAALRAQGIDVLPFQRSSDEIPGMSVRQRIVLPIAPIYARRTQRDLADLLRTERPDLLHLHNSFPLLSPWVVRTAHAHNVPVVHSVHNYRQVCASGIYFRDGQVCMDCRGRAFGLPAIRHSCYRGSAAQSAVIATALAVHRGTWRSVERFIANTTHIAEHLESYGIPAERIAVKPNAVPDPGDHTELGSGFLFAGQLSLEKGVQLLVEAWCRSADGSLGELRIAGDGPLRDLVERTAAERRDVVYLGFLDHAALRAAMRAAAVVVAPSTWHDVAPMVITEALANARPVLGTTLGGIPFLIGAEGASATPAGWVVEPSVDALATVLPVARAEAASLCAIARRRYLTVLHPDVVTAALLDVYRSVLDAPGAVSPAMPSQPAGATLRR
jgi:glycosyltransferase involved in cell wall biosynthesis